MTGAIPPYGAHYRLMRRDQWREGFTNSVYVRRDFNVWSIQAQTGSKKWWVYYGHTPVGHPFPSLTTAMAALNTVMGTLYGGASLAATS